MLFCGDAGVVKRATLRPWWLSAYEGANPSLRILKKNDKQKKNKQTNEKEDKYSIS